MSLKRTFLVKGHVNSYECEKFSKRILSDFNSIIEVLPLKVYFTKHEQSYKINSVYLYNKKKCPSKIPLSRMAPHLSLTLTLSFSRSKLKVGTENNGFPE